MGAAIAPVTWAKGEGIALAAVAQEKAGSSYLDVMKLATNGRQLLAMRDARYPVYLARLIATLAALSLN